MGTIWRRTAEAVSVRPGNDTRANDVIFAYIPPLFFRHYADLARAWPLFPKFLPADWAFNNDHVVPVDCCAMNTPAFFHRL